MTRKRFTKLLMGLDLSRNTAQACAATARKEYGSYAKGAYVFGWLMLDICAEVAQELTPLIMEQLQELLPAGGGGT